jgi:hypothetical protein
VPKHRKEGAFEAFRDKSEFDVTALEREYPGIRRVDEKIKLMIDSQLSAHRNDIVRDAGLPFVKCQDAY